MSMILQHKACLILIPLLFTTLFANELPTISLSGGHGLYPAEKSPRLLETTSLPYSFMSPIAAVQADLGELYYKKNGIAKTERNRILMIITISSNETGFIREDYLDFPNSFNCDPSYCDLEEDSSTISYHSTWIRGETRRINLKNPISIANGAWQLLNPALYFENPQRMYTVSGVMRIGWVGLGTGSEARKNFQTDNPIFSIVYNTTSDTGDLIFGFNSSLADSSKPVVTFTTTPNWEMQLVSISVGDKPVYFVDNTKSQPLVFDLKSKDIQLFRDATLSLLSELGRQGLYCYDFECTSETLEGLPPIIFVLSDNTQISLGPDIYMKREKNDAGQSIYRTIRFLYRRQVEVYKNPIVLGEDVLAHFYSVFQQIDQVNTITLYSLASNTTIAEEQEITSSESKQPEMPVSEHSDAPSPSIRLIFIVCICITIGLGFTCYLFLRQRKRSSKSQVMWN